MLNCAVTCRGTDKKPCDNILNALSSVKLVGAFDKLGGSDMFKTMDMTASLNNVLGTVDDICDKFMGVTPKLTLNDDTLGNPLECRANR